MKEDAAAGGGAPPPAQAPAVPPATPPPVISAAERLAMSAAEAEILQAEIFGRLAAMLAEADPEAGAYPRPLFSST